MILLLLEEKDLFSNFGIFCNKAGLGPVWQYRSTDSWIKCFADKLHERIFNAAVCEKPKIFLVIEDLPALLLRVRFTKTNLNHLDVQKKQF